MKTYTFKMKCVWMLCAICMAICFASCKDKTEDYSNVPGAQSYNWSVNEMANPKGEVLNYSFFSHSNWRVTCNADWCTVQPTEGGKGASQFQIDVQANNSNSSRKADIHISFDAYQSISFVLEQDEMKDIMAYNVVIDEILADYYLWNEEYQSMKRDLSIPYVDFYDNFLKKTLLEMNTNTYDKKQSNGSYSVYSYVDRVETNASRSDSRAGGVNHGVKKPGPVKGYGFAGLTLVSFSNSENYGIAVKALYPDSPGHLMGMIRGDIITKINGNVITESNLENYYLNLLMEENEAVKLDFIRGDKMEQITLTPMEYEENPILKSTVLEENGYRIGYLNYHSFMAGYDNELLDAIAELKSEGITELVLDLRYNNGGHVVSCNMLSACIAGDACKDQKSSYYRFNEDRMINWEQTMKQTGYKYDHEAKMFYTLYKYPTYYGVDLSNYALGLNRLFVLVSSSSASASESLILDLKGIDFPVVMIGAKTHGKNVGMEYIEFKEGDYTYEMYPVTYQFYNAKKESFKPDGMDVDYEEIDWNNGYVDFGDINDRMLGKAIELITGQNSARSVSSRMEEVSYVLDKNKVLPPVPSRFKGGHIQLPLNK